MPQLRLRYVADDGMHVVDLPMDDESVFIVSIELDDEPICGIDRLVDVDDGAVTYVPGHWPDGQNGRAGWVRLAEIDETEIEARIIADGDHPAAASAATPS